jgi:hypothetical protein
LSKKKENEAKKILEKVASTNGKQFNDELWNRFLSAEEADKVCLIYFNIVFLFIMINIG